VKPVTTLTACEQFFYENAGWSYTPGKETREEGRTRCAVALAAAENLLIEAIRNGAVEVTVEDDETSTREERARRYGILFRIRGRVGPSLWALDDVNPEGYGRVVRAELALECVDRLAVEAGRYVP
jgi:hypothetical protein